MLETVKVIQERPLSDELLREIPVFENFLHKIGFKRNEGAIYGLLVLSEKPLSSEEIEQTLNLSQSAVSQALKKLAHFGAIETRESRLSDKKVKEHFAKEDSLSVVASVFRKREQENIEEFKKMAERIYSASTDQNPVRKSRLKSIILTCDMAESVMNFVIGLVGKNNAPLYEEVVTVLPKILNTITNQGEGLSLKASHLTGSLTKKGSTILQKKLKEGLIKITQESFSGGDQSRSKNVK
jgi:DNA-binding transcriptional regulator GbsR (MarR family)